MTQSLATSQRFKQVPWMDWQFWMQALWPWQKKNQEKLKSTSQPYAFPFPFRKKWRNIIWEIQSFRRFCLLWTASYRGFWREFYHHIIVYCMGEIIISYLMSWADVYEYILNDYITFSALKPYSVSKIICFIFLFNEV